MSFNSPVCGYNSTMKKLHYRIPESLEHARHQLRFEDKRCKKTDEELGKGFAKFGEMLHRKSTRLPGKPR